MWIVIPVLLTAHVLVCLLMVAVTLMQLPRSEGLGAAFGGGVTENLFGAQTTNVLTKFTVWLGMAFFVITLLLAFAYANDGSTGARLEKELLASPQPTAQPTASPAQSPAAEPSATQPAAESPESPVQPAPVPVVPDAAPQSVPPQATLDSNSQLPASSPSGSVLDGTSNPLELRPPAPSPVPAATP